MAGGDNINLQVGSVSRATPIRNAPNGTGQPAPASALAANNAPAPVPVARLISLANELAEQGPPVDFARIATLRNAIANGAYATDAALIANAAFRFYQGGSD